MEPVSVSQTDKPSPSVSTSESKSKSKHTSTLKLSFKERLAQASRAIEISSLKDTSRASDEILKSIYLSQSLSKSESYAQSVSEFLSTRVALYQGYKSNFTESLDCNESVSTSEVAYEKDSESVASISPASDYSRDLPRYSVSDSAVQSVQASHTASLSLNESKLLSQSQSVSLIEQLRSLNHSESVKVSELASVRESGAIRYSLEPLSVITSISAKQSESLLLSKLIETSHSLNQGESSAEGRDLSVSTSELFSKENGQNLRSQTVSSNINEIDRLVHEALSKLDAVNSEWLGRDADSEVAQSESLNISQNQLELMASLSESISLAVAQSEQIQSLDKPKSDAVRKKPNIEEYLCRKYPSKRIKESELDYIRNDLEQQGYLNDQKISYAFYRYDSEKPNVYYVGQELKKRGFKIVKDNNKSSSQIETTKVKSKPKQIKTSKTKSQKPVNDVDDDFFDDIEDESLNDYLSSAEFKRKLAASKITYHYRDNDELLLEYEKHQKSNPKEALRVRNEIIEANQSLVINLANKYAKSHNMGSLELDDLIFEGNLGLIKAIEKFDSSQGNQLSTYATWWIKQAIYRAVDDQAYLIRIPVHMQENLRKLSRIESKYLCIQGTVDDRAVMEELKIDETKLEEYRRYRQQFGNMVSLDTNLNQDEGDSSLVEFLSEEDSIFNNEVDTLEEQILIECDKQWLYEIMDQRLKPRERRIIELRYGLNGGEPQTLEEISKVFGVTRERIRQIESKALRKLRFVVMQNEG
ncbi:sigma-70 family RNA polymerase sigma factor [Ligilactobacillus equi]